MKWQKNIALIHSLDSPIIEKITVPGSKSYTNRALIVASLANGKSILTGCSNSNDSLILIKSLQLLSIEITVDGNTVIVNGNGGKFKKYTGTINVEDAGTVMRFLTALCCLIPGEIILEGSSRMYRRPIKGLVDGLIHLGADITYLGEIGYPPIKIKGGKIKGGKVKVDASESSQFISALLMIAPKLDSDLEIITTGEIASTPYINMAIAVMNHFGAEVEEQAGKYLIRADSAYSPSNYTIEGDASCASYFFALAAITQSTICVNNLSPSSLQGDVKFADVLKQMGCKVSMGENYIEVTGPKELKGITADMRNMQDVAQTLSVVAAFAKGTTILKGLKNLEIKETKRLTALQKELTKIGIRCSTDGERLIIHGGNPQGALINTYNDHRMAMAFAIAGARINDLKIESPEAVKKSFPDFWDTLRKTGIKVDIEKTPQNIVLIGFMGAGKTTIGKLLGKELQTPILETDDEIVRRSGMKTVNEVFEKNGEFYFRKMEEEVISDYSQKINCIISCGGGVIKNHESMKALKENGKILFLYASFETSIERIKDQTLRPLFTDREKAKELYLQRLPLYQTYADEIIQTDGLTPDEVVESIISKVMTHHG